MEGIHLHIRVDGKDFLLGTIYFRYSHVLGKMNDLAL